MSTFEVHGPFPINYEKRPGGRTLVFDRFWNEENSASYLAKEKGCYVFAIRNRGISPVYVGKATKTFKQETFNNPNRHKYHSGFSQCAKGTPIMYFVVHPTQRGKTNAKQIGEIENFLIQAGAAKNPNLQNIRGLARPAWAINGVVRSGSGRRSSAAKDFRTLFDINL